MCNPRSALFLLFLLLFSTPLWADAYTLTPFRAAYIAELDAGLSVRGEAVRELAQIDRGEWQLSNNAQASVATIRESTRVRLDGAHVLPLHYDYSRRVLTRRRAAELHFDWQAMQVTTDIDNKPWKMPIRNGTHDKLSYQLQMPADIAAGKTELRYQVADGGQLQTYLFKVTGEEQVKTPMGTYMAVRVERDRGEDAGRETHIWFAPELNYMIVRLEQVESDGKTFALLLKSLK